MEEAEGKWKKLGYIAYNVSGVSAMYLHTYCSTYVCEPIIHEQICPLTQSKSLFDIIFPNIITAIAGAELDGWTHSVYGPDLDAIQKEDETGRLFEAIIKTLGPGQYCWTKRFVWTPTNASGGRTGNVWT